MGKLSSGELIASDSRPNRDKTDLIQGAFSKVGMIGMLPPFLTGIDLLFNVL